MTSKLREAIRVTCLLAIVVSGITAAFSWLGVEKPDLTIWILRISSSVVFVAAFAILLYVNFSRDKVPEYLAQLFPDFIDCEGFCFAVAAQAENNICFLEIFFQNRHSLTCTGRIALIPTRKLFATDQDAMIACEVKCPGGAFGVVRIPVPIDPDQQGDKHKFDVTAGVHFPEGRGKTLWYRDGFFVRSRISFQHQFQTALTRLADMRESGPFVQSAIMKKLAFPYGVVAELPKDTLSETRILWSPSDPELPDDFRITG